MRCAVGITGLYCTGCTAEEHIKMVARELRGGPDVLRVCVFYHGGEDLLMPWEPAAYKDYKWIVADPQLLGGSLAIRGTRLSVSLILECLSNGMSLEDIDSAFANVFPHEALPEVLKVASELTDSFHVAA